MPPESRYKTIEDVLTFPVWTLVISGGARSEGVFRPRIPLTDLSDLDGDALVGDNWFPCPALEEVDIMAFLSAGFRFGFILAAATGVGIRLPSSAFVNLGIDVGVVGAVLTGPACGC